MAYTLFHAPLLPKFDPTFTPPADFALLPLFARRDIAITTVHKCYHIQRKIHSLLEPTKAAAIAAVTAQSGSNNSPDADGAGTKATELELELNRELNRHVCQLITALAVIVRMRYIHIPKRALGAPTHAEYVRIARDHNGMLQQGREFAINLLTMVSKDRSASTSNTTAATNILIRLATPLLDPADFNPIAAAPANADPARDTTIKAVAAPAASPKAAQPADAPATPAPVPTPAPAPVPAPAPAPAIWPATSPLPLGPILDYSPDGTSASPIAPALTPAPTPQNAKLRDLRRRVEGSNSGSLLGHAV